MELQWRGIRDLGLGEKSPSTLCHVVHGMSQHPSWAAHLGPTEGRTLEGEGLSSVTGVVGLRARHVDVSESINPKKTAYAEGKTWAASVQRLKNGPASNLGELPHPPRVLLGLCKWEIGGGIN